MRSAKRVKARGRAAEAPPVIRAKAPEKDETKPNRRMIEAALRELANAYNPFGNTAEEIELQARYDKRYRLLQNDPELLAMSKKLKKMSNKRRRDKERRKEKIAAVRRLYLVEGVSPTVLRELQLLVLELNDESGRRTKAYEEEDA